MVAYEIIVTKNNHNKKKNNKISHKIETSEKSIKIYNT